MQTQTGVGAFTADTRINRSGFWGDCPIGAIHEDPGIGYGFTDDFVDVQLPGTQTTEIAWGGKYKVFSDDSGYVKADETFNSVETPGGILAFNADTANDAASLATEAEPFRLSGVKSTSGKLWFECRVAASSIATNGIGFFVGLAETQLWTLAQGVPFAGSDTITNTAAAIGFHHPEDDTTTMDTVYSDRATSFTKVADAAVTGFAANTWMKLGMKYDPGDANKCVRFYMNGVELAAPVTLATLIALTNLDAGTVGLIYAMIADSAGTAIVSYMDWWSCYQLRPT